MDEILFVTTTMYRGPRICPRFASRVSSPVGPKARFKFEVFGPISTLSNFLASVEASVIRILVATKYFGLKANKRVSQYEIDVRKGVDDRFSNGIANISTDILENISDNGRDEGY